MVRWNLPNAQGVKPPWNKALTGQRIPKKLPLRIIASHRLECPRTFLNVRCLNGTQKYLH
jgi:hypothetical protein